MKLEEMKMKELFDMSHTIAERIFGQSRISMGGTAGDRRFHPFFWDPFFLKNEYRKIGKDIWIHKTAKVAPTIMMTGPMIICAGANVRHNAFLRGNVIIGEKAVVGNSCELKNALLFDEVQVPPLQLCRRFHPGLQGTYGRRRSDL